MFCEVPVGNALGFGSGADPLCLYFFGNFTDSEFVFYVGVTRIPLVEFFFNDFRGVFDVPTALSPFTGGGGTS